MLNDEGKRPHAAPGGAARRRSAGLRWYGRSPDGSVENFPGAKLRFAEIDPALIDQALQTGHPLVGRVMLTDEDGWPRCARLHPPAITWSIETPERSAHSSESGS